MRRPLTNKANKYARDIVSGKILACQYVISACQRHLNDLERAKKKSFPYYFNPDMSEKMLSFAQNMEHTKGKWAGKPLFLEPWQCFCLGIPFGWLKKGDNLRRFREIFLLVPRKNGKSIKGAALGNYMFAADGEAGSEVYSVANSLKQAHEVFRPAWLMTAALPDYRKHFGIELGGTRKNPGNIFSLKNNSRFEALIRKPGDGASPHAWIQDEYHEAKSEDSYDTGKTGMGSRSQPMMIVVSSAGTNTASPCYVLQKQVEKILSGETVNDEIFGIIYSIDKDDDWTDFKNWEKANPNIGVSVSKDFLKSQLKTGVQNSRKQNIIKCKHLNLWSNAGSAWLNMVEWEKSSRDLNILDFTEQPCYIGLDLASKIDIASKMYLFKQDDDYYLFSQHYLPEERIQGEDQAHYAGWFEDEYIEVTPGARIDLEKIQDDIKEDAKTFDLSGMENGGGEVCNDPWNAQQLITNLMAEDIACVEIPQTVVHLSEPMKEIEAAIKSGNFYHDGNPATTWMVGNVCCRIDKKENVFPYKEAPENKIDGAVATITAMSRAMYSEHTGKSVYETRGVIAL